MKNMRTGISGWLSICLLAILGIGVGPANAQTPAVSTDKLGWTQRAASDEISVLTFILVVDGQRQAVPAASVTCTATATAGVYECVAPFPAMTPGPHTLALIAVRQEGSVALESQPSATFPITLVVAPAAPEALKVVR